MAASGPYESLDVRLIKDAAPVVDSDWVPFLAGHNLRSSLVIAHTRSATRGNRSYSNAQPFMRKLAGRAHLFAHNGDLPGMLKSKALEASRYHAIGDTDSERAFCELLDRMASIWARQNAAPPLRERFRIVASFASELRTMGPANFLYGDGEVLFAYGHRRKHADTSRVEPPGLVSLQRQCPAGQDGLASSGLTTGSSSPQFASVPLTGERWEPFSEGELVAASHGQIIARQLAGSDVEYYQQNGEPVGSGRDNNSGSNVALSRLSLL